MTLRLLTLALLLLIATGCQNRVAEDASARKIAVRESTLAANYAADNQHVYEVSGGGQSRLVRGDHLVISEDWGRLSWNVYDSEYNVIAAGGEGTMVREVHP